MSRGLGFSTLRRRPVVVSLLPRLASLVVLVLFLLLTSACTAPPEADRQQTSAPERDGSQVGSSEPAASDRDDEGTPEGKWRRARHEPSRSASGEEILPEEQARLLVLPYLQGYKPAGDEPQITVYDAEKTQPGLNLVLSGHAPEALLATLDGRVLHRWRYPLQELWPDLYAQNADAMRKLEYWRRALLLDDGSLLAIYEGLGLVKLDARSRLQWAKRGGVHHDLALTEDGTIWVLDRDGKLLPRIHPTEGVLEDFVTLLTPDGEVQRRISLLEALEASEHAHLLERRPDSGDILHTNTLKLLDGRHAHVHPAFAAGNLLLSFRELDAIAVLDPRTERIVWALGNGFRRQHEPTLVEPGRILLFDNQGPFVETPSLRRSRVLELDPTSGDVLWQYGGTRQVDFLSRTLGVSHRMTNGNTLIVESENGRAFEVTRAGEIVWEFYNPHRAGENQELIAVLFDVIRLSEEHPFIQRALASQGGAVR